MGNTKSEFSENRNGEPWWGNNIELEHPHPFKTKNTTKNVAIQTGSEEQSDSIKGRLGEVSGVKKKNIIDVDEAASFENHLSELQRRRRTIIGAKKMEMDALREENAELRRLLECERHRSATNGNQGLQDQSDLGKNLHEENVELKEKIVRLEEELNTANMMKDRYRELSVSVATLQKDLQHANSEIVNFEKERDEYNTHVLALKDIIAVSKQMLLMRETQIKELTDKVKEIEASIAQNETKILAEDLRHEYQRQLGNIRQLRTLYEQRQTALRTERDALKSQLDDATITLENELSKNKDLDNRVDELEKENSSKGEKIDNLEATLATTNAEFKEMKAELSVINQLFSQSLLGFNNGQEVDFDNLRKTLEDNHDLLTDIVIKEKCSALPKVFLDLINQVNEKDKKEAHEEAGTSENTNDSENQVENSEYQNSASQKTLSSPMEIVENLPKVWKVLAELLSQQSGPINSIDAEGTGDTNPCYKSVETPTGTTLVLSVSKTYIRLKDLILEKRLLEQEMGKLKRLNTHLEIRLHDQEKRFETVSSELAKTWNMVGKMQKQHHQLHTQEKILRYELAQKRKLLTELKEELEYCREKWLQAKEKNAITEKQWRQLRNEFAARKCTQTDELNNSVESGYSDDRESCSEDDDNEANVGQPVIAQEPVEVEQMKTEASEDVLESGENQIILPEVISESGPNETLEDDAIEPLEAIAVEEMIDAAILSDLVIAEHMETYGITLENLDAESNICQEPESGESVAISDETDGANCSVYSEAPKTESVLAKDCESSSKTKDIVDTYRKLEEDILLTIRKTQNGEAIENDAEISTDKEEEGLPELSEELVPVENVNQPGTSKSKVDLEPQPLGLDATVASSSKVLTLEERLAAREERLTRLEKQCSDLVEKNKETMDRGVRISNTLDNLHEQYGRNSESEQNGGDSV